MTITIPYPEGIDKAKYDFIVTHMFTYDINSYKAGDIETLDVTKTEEGLRFTVMSLSPISVAWKEIAVEKETTTLNKETTTSNNNEESTSNNKETTTVKNQTATNSIKTGDNTSIVFWIVLGLSAVCGCLITGWKNRKKHLV